MSRCRRHAVGPGDIIRAINGVGHSQAEAVASLLGYRFVSSPGVPSTLLAAPQGAVPVTPEPQEPELETHKPTEPDTRLEPLPPDGGTGREPDWFATVEPLAIASAVTEPPLPPQLLEPCRERAVLREVLGVWRPGREVDADAFVEIVAHGYVVRSLPRRARLALTGRIHLLLDVGPCMQPFLSDLEQLLVSIERVLPSDLLSVREIDGQPPPLTDSEPAPRTTVVAATYLGSPSSDWMLPESDPGQWLAYAGQLRARDCSLVALVPHDPARVPPELLGHLLVFCWDRTASARRARGGRRDRRRR